MWQRNQERKPRKVKKISFDDIFTYATCPIKYKLKKSNAVQPLPRDIYAVATMNSIIRYFDYIGMGRSEKAAIKAATNRFVEEWSAYSVDLAKNADAYKFYSKGNLLTTRIQSIYDPTRDEVAATRFPIEVSVTPSIIVTDSIDLILVHKNRSPNADKPKTIF